MSAQRADVPHDWTLHDRGACHGMDTNLFYPEPPEVETTRAGRPYRMALTLDPGYLAAIARGRAICNPCPVRYQCLAEAVHTLDELDYGIRGATTPVERFRIRRSSTEVRFVDAMAQLEAGGLEATG